MACPNCGESAAATCILCMDQAIHQAVDAERRWAEARLALVNSRVDELVRRLNALQAAVPGRLGR